MIFDDFLLLIIQFVLMNFIFNEKQGGASRHSQKGCLMGNGVVVAAVVVRKRLVEKHPD